MSPTPYLLVLLLACTMVSANLHQLKRLLRRYYEGDDEDLYRRESDPYDLYSGSGSGSGSSPAPETQPPPTQPPTPPTTTELVSRKKSQSPWAVCDEDALESICRGKCAMSFCRDYPEASCKPNNCEECTPEWWVGSQKVNCTGRPVYCPGLWMRRGNNCYRVQNRYGYDFKGAQKYCLRQGGHLVTIESSTEQANIETLPMKSSNGYWTGGIKVGSSWKWQTPNGNIALSYTRWNSGEPNNRGFDGMPENAIVMKESSRYWKWNDVTSFMKYYPVCEAERDKVQTHCDSKPCMNGGSCINVGQDMYKCECGKHYSGKYCELYNDNSAWNAYEGHLYLVVADYAFNRQDAVTYCGMHNAYLMSVNSRGESDFISSVLAKRGIQDPTYRFYIGGYKTRNKIMWADGTELSGYTNWGFGEPNMSSERFMMLKFYLENDKWMWNDTPDTWLANFICEKPNDGAEKRRGLNGVSHHAHGKRRMLKRLFHKRWSHPKSTMEY